jgi:hypothetical protein
MVMSNEQYIGLSAGNIPTRSRFRRGSLTLSHSAGSDVDFALQSVDLVGGLTISLEAIDSTLESYTDIVEVAMLHCCTHGEPPPVQSFLNHFRI